MRLKAGDVIVLQGNLNTMPDALGELRCLPLAARDLRLGAGRQSILPLLVLLTAMAAVSLHVVPVQIAFFSAAVVLSQRRKLRELMPYAVAVLLTVSAFFLFIMVSTDFSSSLMSFSAELISFILDRMFLPTSSAIWSMFTNFTPWIVATLSSTVLGLDRSKIIIPWRLALIAFSILSNVSRR